MIHVVSIGKRRDGHSRPTLSHHVGLPLSSYKGPGVDPQQVRGRVGVQLAMRLRLSGDLAAFESQNAYPVIAKYILIVRSPTTTYTI